MAIGGVVYMCNRPPGTNWYYKHAVALGKHQSDLKLYQLHNNNIYHFPSDLINNIQANHNHNHQNQPHTHNTSSSGSTTTMSLNSTNCKAERQQSVAVCPSAPNGETHTYASGSCPVNIVKSQKGHRKKPP